MRVDQSCSEAGVPAEAVRAPLVGESAPLPAATPQAAPWGAPASVRLLGGQAPVALGDRASSRPGSGAGPDGTWPSLARAAPGNVVTTAPLPWSLRRHRLPWAAVDPPGNTAGTQGRELTGGFPIATLNFCTYFG